MYTHTPVYILRNAPIQNALVYISFCGKQKNSFSFLQFLLQKSEILTYILLEGASLSLSLSGWGRGST